MTNNGRLRLQALGIGCNPVTDLSPLADNPHLTSLNVSSLDLSDTDVIAILSHLRALSSPRTLGIYEADCSDYSGLDALEHLKAV